MGNNPPDDGGLADTLPSTELNSAEGHHQALSWILGPFLGQTYMGTVAG